MNLIIKIAWRNILRHKGKSVIIGVILFLGALIMTVGNGVISGMDVGLRENIINCFTGDAVVISDKQQSDNVFLEMMGKAVEPAYNVVDIKKTLDKQNYISRYLPVGKNMALVLNEDGGSMGNAYLMGVDFEKYRAVFPGNVKPIEGRLPNPGEKGALVPTGARKQAYDFMNIWFMPENDTLHVANLTPEALVNKSGLSLKNSLVLMGFNDDNSTSDIRLGIKGIVKYKALNHIWGNFVIVDIESYRQCMGYFSASEKAAVLPPEQKSLFSMDNTNLDVMFNDNSMVLVFFKHGTPLDQGLQNLNATLKNANLGARAVSWKKAIGPIGNMAALIKTALFVFVMFLFFVAIIIIVNTLSMAALERTSEIGMMRAVGAKKGFNRDFVRGIRRRWNRNRYHCGQAPDACPHYLRQRYDPITLWRRYVQAFSVGWRYRRGDFSIGNCYGHCGAVSIKSR